MCLVFPQEIFSLVEGSGYFLVNSSEQDIATITYMEAESSIQVSSRDSPRPREHGWEGVIVCLKVVTKVTLGSFSFFNLRRFLNQK